MEGYKYLVPGGKPNKGANLNYATQTNNENVYFAE